MTATFLGGNYVSAGRPPPETSFIIDIIDEESGEFVGAPAFINFKVEGDGIVSTYTFNITKSPEEIPYLPPSNATITITAHAEGYKESAPYVYVVPSKPSSSGILFNHTFHLEKISPTEVSVHITDKQNKPLANANCTVNIVSTDEKKSYKTDENGDIDFSAQMVNYHITVSKDGYYTKEKDIIVDHNLSQTDFNITLQKIPPQYTRAVYLTIKDKNDNPVEGAEVEVHSPEIDVANTTNENGSVMFRLPSDDYTLTISASGYETAEYPLWIDNEPTAFKDYFILTKSKFSLLDYWYLWIVLIAVIVAVITALARRK